MAYRQGNCPRIGVRLVAVPVEPVIDLPATVLNRRPDVQSAWLAVAASTERVEVADADRYPRPTIGFDVTSSATEASELFDDWLARLAGNLLAPLYDGGRRRAEVARSEAVQRERLNAYGETVLGALQEIDDAIIEERQEQEFSPRCVGNRKPPANRFTANARFIPGRCFDYLRVLDALSSSQQIDEQLLAARLDVLLRRLDLYRALAGGWDVPRPAWVSPKIPRHHRHRTSETISEKGEERKEASDE